MTRAAMFDNITPIIAPTNAKTTALPNRPASSVRSMMSDPKSGAFIPPRGVSPHVRDQAKAPKLRNFARGPIGFLQWFAAAHPQLFRKMQKDRPDLLQQAREMSQKTIGACPGVSSKTIAGLGAMGAGSSWYDSVINYTGKLLNLYGTYKNIQNGTTQQVQQQVQKQVQNAAANQQPDATGVPQNAPAPAPTSVTSKSPGHSASVGALTVAGIAGAAFIGASMLSRRKRRR